MLSGFLASRLLYKPWLCAVALAVVFLLLRLPPDFADFLGDTDDATRLLLVRDLLRGTPWSDPSVQGFGVQGPVPLHWSRLLDGVLASLTAGLRLFVSPSIAELTLRALWPVSLYGAFLGLLLSLAQRTEGQAVMLLFAGFFFLNGLVSFAFLPGRIDHHNLQILGTVGGFVWLFAPVISRWEALGAGALLGLALGIGVESFPLQALGYGLLGLITLQQPKLTERLLFGLLGACAVMFLHLLITLGVRKAPLFECDQLTWPLFVVFAGAAFLLLPSLARPSLSRFWILMAGLWGCIGLAALFSSCVTHPFGPLTRELEPLWLKDILETQSLQSFAALDTPLAIGNAVSALLGLLASVVLALSRRDVFSIAYAALVGGAVALAFWQMKFFPYAASLGLLPLAVVVHKFSLSAAAMGPRVMTLLSWRLVALLVGSHAGLLALILSASSLFGTRTELQGLASLQMQHKSCSQASSLAFLQRAPSAALTLTPLNTAPHVVAHTPLHVVAAPYHRLDQSLLLQHALWTSEPIVAVQQLRQNGIRFVLSCSPQVSSVLPPAATLEMALAYRQPPQGLRVWGQNGDLTLWEVIPH